MRNCECLDFFVSRFVAAQMAKVKMEKMKKDTWVFFSYLNWTHRCGMNCARLRIAASDICACKDAADDEQEESRECGASTHEEDAWREEAGEK